MDESSDTLHVNNVCYTCLSTENLICVPGNHEEYNEFVKMFLRFTSIEITEKVVVICENCVSKLNESHQFREMCIESYKTFQSLYEEEPGRLEGIETNFHKLENSESTHIAQDTSTSPRQNRGSEDVERDFKHSGQVAPITDRDICTKLTYTQDNSWDTNRPIICGICTEKFEDVLQLHSHFTTKHNKEQDELKKYVEPDEVIHDHQNSFTCSKCGKTFSLLTELKQHVQCHISIKPTVKKQLKSNFICSVCGKEFSTKFLLNRHMMSHTGKKPFECSLCPSRFYTTGDLNVHMRVHTGEKPFACPICEKLFRRSSHLTVHMRTHTGEKPYQCKTCSRSFAQSGDLTAHERIHTGEKPFICNFCAKRFVQGSALKTHLKRHFNVFCTNCQKVFMTYAALKEHQEDCQDSEQSVSSNK